MAALSTEQYSQVTSIKILINESMTFLFGYLVSACAEVGSLWSFYAPNEY